MTQTLFMDHGYLWKYFFIKKVEFLLRKKFLISFNFIKGFARNEKTYFNHQ